MSAPHRRYRQSLVPVLTFDDGTLAGARLHPVGAKEILTDIARLAEPYDTGTGELVLDGS